MTKTSDLDQLTTIQKNINEHFGFEAFLIEASEQIKLNSIVCNLPPGPVRLKRTLTLTFLPIADENTNEVKLLQFYSVLPGTKMIKKVEKLDETLLHISHRTPIGSFSINQESEISYRYVFPISKKIDTDILKFNELLSLYLLSLDMFSIILRDFQNETISYEDILKNV